MRFVVVSDIHLRLQDNMGVIVNGLNSRLSDRLTALTTAVEYAKEKKVKAFIINGDVYDKVNPPEKLRRLFKDTVILPLLKAQIPIIFNMGNHDTNGEIINLETEASIMSSMKEGSIEFITEPTIICLEDIDIYFIPYGFPIPEDSVGCDYCFCHNGIAGAETGVGVIQRDGEELSLEDFSIFKLSIMGHYHKPQRLTCKNGSEVLFVGSTNAWDFGERLDKKRFLDLELTDTGYNYKSVSLPERKFIQIEVEENESWEAKENVSECVVKLVLTGSRTWIKSLDIQSIKKSYEKLGVHKIMIDPKIVRDDRNLILEIDGTETEEQIIRKYAENIGGVDKDLLNLGLKVFRNS